MRKTVILTGFGIWFLSQFAFPCVPIVVKEKHTEIIKMTGKANPDIKYLEATGWLSYTGPEAFSVLSKDKKLIATIANGQLCTFKEDVRQSCSSATNNYVDIKRLNSYFEKKHTYSIYIKIADNKPKKYVFKKVNKRDTDKYRGQRMLASVKDCADWDR